LFNGVSIAMTLKTRLDKFISSFKNEDELRRAVVALLEQMPNTSNVRLTHGRDERGKDVVFYSPGPFAQRELVACVIKNSKIEGSVQSDEGARTVLLQAEQALDTTIARTADGVEERVARVFVISPYDSSVSTVDSIKGKLQGLGGRVTFLCGRELMEKFEEYYPDFMWFQSGSYGSYVTELEKGLNSDSSVANALFRHGFLSVAKQLTSVYVRPKFCRELRRFEICLSPMRVSILRKEITRREAETICHSLRTTGMLVGAASGLDESGRSLQSSLETIAEDVQGRWQAAFEVKRSSHTGKEKLEDPKLKLRSAEDIYNETKELLGRAEPKIKDFHKKVRSLDKLVEFNFKKAASVLRSPLVADYCEVEDVSQRVPSIVKTRDVLLGNVEFDQSVINSLGVDLLITAPAGFGKTSFCKWQTIDDLRRLREGKSTIIPVYVPLHKYSQQEVQSFESTFLRTPELIALWKQRKRGRGELAGRKFRLYLDGLDEVPSVESQREIMEAARKGKQADSTLSIVVTAREHVVGPHLHGLLRVRVRDFDEDQIRELASNWFDADEQKLEEFFSQLNRVPALRAVMRAPLLATLVLAVYKNTETLPESRVSLYEMFVSLLAGGWDIAKNLQRQTEFGSAPKLTVLTKLAAAVHTQCRRDCTQMDFKAAVAETLPGLQSKWERLLEEVIHDGLLVPTGVTYAFAHLSFQEYLAAKDLLEPTGERVSAVLMSFLSGDEWWREVISFYIALAGKPKEVERFIRKTAEDPKLRATHRGVQGRTEFLLRTLIGAYPEALIQSSTFE
jgi:hypothetical protein